MWSLDKEAIWKELSNKLDWEKDLRESVAAFQIDGFKGKIAFTLVSSTGPLRVKPPSPDLKLYLLGYLTTNRKMEMDLGGAAVKGQVVAEHMKAFRAEAYLWQQFSENVYDNYMMHLQRKKAL